MLRVGQGATTTRRTDGGLRREAKCCAGRKAFRKALEEGAGEDARHVQLAMDRMEAGIEAINRQPDFGDERRDEDEVKTPFKNHKAP